MTTLQRAHILGALFTLLAVCGPANEANEGNDVDREMAEQEISGGGTVPETRPFVGRLYVAGTYWCTASLISPDTVLTARHCVPSTLSSMVFKLGAASYPVASSVRHPTADIAVLRLSIAATAAPACLASRAPALGSSMRLAGCGQPTSGVCNTGFTTLGQISSSMYPFGTAFTAVWFGAAYGTTQLAVNFGDSGGPWTSTSQPNALFGVTSGKTGGPGSPYWLGECKLASAATCYAGVAVWPYVAWINAQVGRPVCVL